ncbi:Bug family tripartite tricarboxylate transporter substrate binding protein [Teichococcus oryzae]|uniref:Tripartite tricarboxylate transporter substrate binding protein n=1 Tax=Teichococcus oryzae TaxID=1608942 RepID=A0A5B2TJB0_9PROT|nr:tripartite tricarboxylate transporter substrate binding protein [Pseudoroseomonas oryzae]KAA2214597.1 tripartite tricarboxylate transporter substrate binding protein [Pseudoroseomonas oryzae]
MLPRRPLLALGAAALAAPLAASRIAAAQPAWPDRPVRFVVPFPGGSSPDLTGRLVAQHLSTVLGQPVVVDNRAGAGGNIGTDAVAKATDEVTIGLSINGPLSTAPALYPNLPYDPAKDLVAVSLLVRGGQVLVVHPSVPATDFAGFVAHARANPGKLTFGSVGAGSGGHLAMEDIKARTGITLEHVPYRGFPPAVLDLVAGRISAMVVTAAAILPQLRESQARALAVTTDARMPQLPDVPTLAEVGLPGAASYGWQVLIAPAGTPRERVEMLAREARVALSTDRARQAMDAAAFEVVAGSPEEASAYVAAEAARWGALIRKLGLTLEG